MKRKPRRRSPIKDVAVHQAGQSTERRRVLHTADALVRVAWIGMLWMMVIASWQTLRFGEGVLWFTLVLAVVGTPIGLVLVWRDLERAERHRLGVAGELEAGAQLARLSEHGYLVLHDLIEPGWNIDHIVCGRGGIFAVETKTLTKRVGGSDRAQWNGRELRVNGVLLPRDPVEQARGSARHVERYLADAGLDVQVRPVVLLPGWYIEGGPRAADDPWVLEPKAFVKWVLGADRSCLDPRRAASLKGAVRELRRYAQSRAEIEHAKSDLMS